MRSTLTTRRRVTAGVVAGTLLLAACGGGDSGGDAGSDEALPQVDTEASEPADAEASDQTDSAGAEAAEPSEPADAEASDQTDPAPAPEGSAIVDLVGADVLADADFEGNQLPNVVVDDINTGRKVNFRNLVPQEKPILLWMWAPH